jgi:hypothetical protein
VGNHPREVQPAGVHALSVLQRRHVLSRHRAVHAASIPGMAPVPGIPVGLGVDVGSRWGCFRACRHFHAGHHRHGWLPPLARPALHLLNFRPPRPQGMDPSTPTRGVTKGIDSSDKTSAVSHGQWHLSMNASLNTLQHSVFDE